MAKKCSICNSEIEEENGKLKGSMLKIVENKKKSWIYVCSSCMSSDKGYIEKAKVKSA